MNYTMNTSRTKLCGVAALGTLLLGIMFSASSPAQVASDPAGFCQLTLLGSSDTILSLPFARPKAAWGGVNSASGSTVQALGAPNWTVNQFVYAAGTQPNTYYLRFDSGAKAGFYYPITANASSTLTVNLGMTPSLRWRKTTSFRLCPIGRWQQSSQAEAVSLLPPHRATTTRRYWCRAIPARASTSAQAALILSRVAFGRRSEKAPPI